MDSPGSADRKSSRRSHGSLDVYGLPSETVAKLRQVAGPHGTSQDLRILLVEAVDQMLARTNRFTARSRQFPTLCPQAGNCPGTLADQDGNEAWGNSEGSSCSWAVLPDPIIRSIHQLLQATAPSHVRALLLQVCKGWAAQFKAALDASPQGHSIHNRKCAWRLCSRPPKAKGSLAGFERLRALSIGIIRLPERRLMRLLATLPSLETLDLHFPPCYQPTSPSHLRSLLGIRVPSLGLQFRCPMLSCVQLLALQSIPNLHRLAFKLHRSQCTVDGVKALAAVLVNMAQLQELSIHVYLEGSEALLLGCLEPLSSLPSLMSLKIRTQREPLGEIVELPKLAAVSKMSGLRFLNIDGGTDLTPPDLSLLSSLTRLEGLRLRNSPMLRTPDLTSLAPLSHLTSLDFSMGGFYALSGQSLEIGDDGDDAHLLQGSDWEGEPWDASEPLRVLASLTSLEELELGNRTSLRLLWGENLWFLTQLTGLSKLGLRGCLKDSKCLNSRRQTADRNNILAPIAYLTALQALSLEGYCGGSFLALTSLPLLRHLCLRGCRQLRDHDLESLCAAMPWLSILDVADIEGDKLTSAGVLTALRLLPVLWAAALPGQAITILVVEQLQQMPNLCHVMITRPSRAKLEGVNDGNLLGDVDVRTSRATGDMVRQFLRAELPGKMREHCKFERGGYVDYADWDKWWLSEDEYREQESDADLTGSETDASSSLYDDPETGSSEDGDGISSGDEEDDEDVQELMGMIGNLPNAAMGYMLGAMAADLNANADMLEHDSESDEDFNASSDSDRDDDE